MRCGGGEYAGQPIPNALINYCNREPLTYAMFLLLLNLSTELCEIATSMGRQVKRINGGAHVTSSRDNSSGSSSINSSEEYDFTDSDATVLD